MGRLLFLFALLFLSGCMPGPATRDLNPPLPVRFTSSTWNYNTYNEFPILSISMKLSPPSEQTLGGLPIYRFDHEMVGSKLTVRALIEKVDLMGIHLNPPSGANLSKVPPGKYELIDGFDDRSLGWIDTALGSGSLSPS